MPKFKVLGGTHAEGDRVWHKGQVLETKHDLVAMFANKFERVADNTPVSKHNTLDTTPARSNEAPPPTPPQPTQQAQDKAQQQDGKDEGKDEIVPPKGTDVTEAFKLASDQDYKVFKFKGKFMVYDADDLAAPLNKEPVAEKAVDEVIKLDLEKKK